MRNKAIFGLLLAAAGSVSAALQVDFTSSSSIKTAAKDIAFDIMSYYKGNQSGNDLGLLGSTAVTGKDYWWWNSAVLWSSMIDYWRYTGDDTYNAVVVEALTAQSGRGWPGDQPFLPLNWTTVKVGNDDQGFWALAGIQAAELGFPAAPSGQPSWLELTQGVFDILAARWTTEEAGGCKGGLYWAARLDPAGANALKNTLSTAVFLDLGARLSRFTGNHTYADWAEKTWNWLAGTGLIDREYNVIMGTDAKVNCTQFYDQQLSYVAGVLIEAAAYMSNHTTLPAQKTWQTRLVNLTNRTLTVFFPNQTMEEVSCESSGCYGPDLQMYKGIALRSLTSAVQLAPHLTRDLPLLEEALAMTAKAAVKSCVGGKTGRGCGFGWAVGYDEDEERVDGLYAQMNALAAMLGVLRDGAGRRMVETNATVRVVGSVSSGTGGGGGGGGEAEVGSDGKSGGAAVHVGMGLLLAGLVAAVL